MFVKGGTGGQGSATKGFEGGDGGDVLLRAVSGMNSMNHLYMKSFAALSGSYGAISKGKEKGEGELIFLCGDAQEQM